MATIWSDKPAKIKIGAISVENNYNAKEILDFMKSNNYLLLARLGSDDIYILRSENLTMLQRLGLLKTELIHRIKGKDKKLIYHWNQYQAYLPQFAGGL